MQKVIDQIKTSLAEQFKKTVRVSIVQMKRTEFKVNCSELTNSDIFFLYDLTRTGVCTVDVKRSGTGLVVIVIY